MQNMRPCGLPGHHPRSMVLSKALLSSLNRSSWHWPAHTIRTAPIPCAAAGDPAGGIAARGRRPAMALGLLGAGDAPGGVTKCGAGTMARRGCGSRGGVAGDPAAGVPKSRLRGTGRPALRRGRPRDPAAGIPIRRPRVSAGSSLGGRRADDPSGRIANGRPLLPAGQLLPVDRLHNPSRGIPHHFPAGLRHRGQGKSK